MNNLALFDRAPSVSPALASDTDARADSGAASAKLALAALHALVEHELLKTLTDTQLKHELPGIARHQLRKTLSAMVLQVIYGIRCDAQFSSLLQSNALFRWFIGAADQLSLTEANTYIEHRKHLLQSRQFRALFARIVLLGDEKKLLTFHLFRVDGAMARAWGSIAECHSILEEVVEGRGPPTVGGGPSVVRG